MLSIVNVEQPLKVELFKKCVVYLRWIAIKAVVVKGRTTHVPGVHDRHSPHSRIALLMCLHEDAKHLKRVELVCLRHQRSSYGYDLLSMEPPGHAVTSPRGEQKLDT